ncbi:hypothetical protein BD414DRAFT_533287 [Trametes punicea]|nr:hypothetical protein BD414DRAFT_533287 [Trametes punicea]
MLSKFSLSLRTARDAGRRKLDSDSPRINLADYTNPTEPPFPTGWTWCDSMQVWLPDDLSISSGLLFGDPFACNRCRPSPAAPPPRPKLVHRLTSRENWRLPGEDRKPRKDRTIVNDGYVVRASGVTFSQIQLQVLQNVESCCGSSISGLPRQYLF